MTRVLLSDSGGRVDILITHGGRLPAETTQIFGRSMEAAAVGEALASARLVTITGPGGVGKTRLAVRVGHELGTWFPDGVYLVQLAEVEDAAGVAAAAAAALGRPATQAGELADVLHGSQPLLILDTCDHLVDACAAFADALLRGADGPRLLATSRQALDLPGEVIIGLLPLAVPDDGGAAVELFADRVAAAMPGFAITAATLSQVVQLCRQLDGLPLAIELAAVRLRAVGLDELLTRLPGRTGLLGGSRTTRRHQTLRACLQWSYDLCTPAERLLWTRLSVFAAEFGLGAAEAVCAGGELATGDILDTLIGLVDKSVALLVDHTSGSREARYRLLNLTREFGGEQLAGDGPDDYAARHRDHYLNLARELADAAGPADAVTSEWLSRAAADAANLELARDRSLAAGGARRAELAAVTAVLDLVREAAAGAPAAPWPRSALPPPAALVAPPGLGRRVAAADLAEAIRAWEQLTAREREVSALVAEGLTNKDIAARLVVSKRTVDAHIEHILGKLGYVSRVQIAALAAAQPVAGRPPPAGPAPSEPARRAEADRGHGASPLPPPF